MEKTEPVNGEEIDGLISSDNKLIVRALKVNTERLDDVIDKLGDVINKLEDVKEALQG